MPVHQPRKHKKFVIEAKTLTMNRNDSSESNLGVKFSLLDLFIIVSAISILAVNYIQIWDATGYSFSAYDYPTILPVARGYMFAWIACAIAGVFMFRHSSRRSTRRALGITTAFAVFAFAYNYYLTITTM
jgi:putative Ca2+/H+ antiporter (TMEM165/GDT1 family)